MLCGGIVEGSPQPPERGALPSEGNQGDEWDAYVVLGRMTGTNAGSPAGREPHGDGVPIVVVGVTTQQGGRESRPQGEGAQVANGHTNGLRDGEIRCLARRSRASAKEKLAA